jgi:hypothetical protein
LTRNLPQHRLVQGDVATVVHVYDDGKAYEVEFVTLAGRTVAVVTVEVASVRPIRADEIANARQAAA